MTLTSHVIIYIYRNYNKNILKYNKLNLFKEIAIGFYYSFLTTSRFSARFLFKLVNTAVILAFHCCILTSDPAKHAIPKTVEVAYSMGVGELGWQYGTGLKSHGTVKNWCTWRGWPVNWMTVISARWWSKHAIPKTVEVDIPLGIYGKRLSGRWTII